MPKGIDPWHDVSSANRKVIDKFEEDLTLREDRAETTIKGYKDTMIRYARFLGKRTFQDVVDNPEIMNEWLLHVKSNGYKVGSRNTEKTGVIVFFKWLNKGNKPECLENVRFVTKKQAKQYEDPEANKKKEITEEDYQLMLEASVKHPESLQVPAMIEVLRWYGCRPVELVSMNIGGTGKDEMGVYITIKHSKTHTRKIYVKDYDFPHLLKYLDKHPFRGQPDKPVWISYYKREKHLQRLDSNDVYQRVRRVKIIAGIQHKLNPYSFRHRCMNYRILENGLNVQQASYFFGTDINTIMQNYIHNKQENYVKWLQNQNKDTDLKPSYNELEEEKQKLESEYEERFKHLEEKMSILDSAMARSARQHKPEINNEKIIQDYYRLREGLSKVYNQLLAEGKTDEAEQFRQLAEQGLT